MAKYRSALPQLAGGIFLADGGLETTLIFHDGFDLPEFAAFTLLESEKGQEALGRYYTTHASIAAAHGVGFVIDSATWRSSADWGAKLGYSAADLDRLNRESIVLAEKVREAHETDASPMVINGCVGPRGDGYNPEVMMTSEDAQLYHSQQIASFAESSADMVTAVTMTYSDEAIGIVRAAERAQIPSCISFTVETDGRLPSGESLREAVTRVDAATDGATAYFMVNCAHTTHFDDALATGEDFLNRVRGLRANASRLSHAELDEAEVLDDGDPMEFGELYRQLVQMLPNLVVLGGCCGTDHRHIEEIARSCVRS